MTFKSLSLNFRNQILSTIEFSIFSNCVNETGYGGAIYLKNSFALISHCYFSNCVAYLGGCIYSSESTVSIQFSQILSSRCVYGINPNENLGGHALCADSGFLLQMDYVQFISCPVSHNDQGESIIVSHGKRHYFSYINMSHCKSRSGGFISMRKPENETIINFINIVDSSEYTLIENSLTQCQTSFSNFFRNSVSGFLFAGMQLLFNCVIIGNSDKQIQGTISFIDCIGTFYGNAHNISDTASYAFPSYRFLETEAIKRKITLRLSTLFLAPMVLSSIK